MQCPKCKGKNIRKNGTRIASGDIRLQNYLCKDCRHQWQPDKPERQFSKANEANRRFDRKTYRLYQMKLRKDNAEHAEVLAKLEGYAKAYPDNKSATVKKMIEVLREYFPTVRAGNKDE